MQKVSKDQLLNAVLENKGHKTPLFLHPCMTESDVIQIAAHLCQMGDEVASSSRFNGCTQELSVWDKGSEGCKIYIHFGD